MADNKEIVRAIEKMSREVCKTLNDIGKQMNDIGKQMNDIGKQMNDIGKQMNKALGKMADNMEQKQFDEFDPPAVGTAVQNMRGCVMLNAVDFEALVRETDEELES